MNVDSVPSADAPSAATPGSPARAPHKSNPILPGYYADPSIVHHEGREYLYATIDPWGGETLGCWESADFKHWTYRELNWPTKTVCRSARSSGAMVWAPSVVRAADGCFYLYVSVGSEVWVGRAEHPLGPWQDLCEGRPLIPFDYKPGYHMIDAEAFVDEDGAAYLYWGSGFEWVNGRCWVAKLKPDMKSFDGEPVEVTPGNYFEAPFLTKHAGRYYLMYSQGVTIQDTYQVHYAIGDSPLGPFVEAPNSPVLVTDRPRDVVSPGHHAVFTRAGRSYILYHRHSVPFDPVFIGRQVCVDELRFTPDGLIAKIEPTHEGPELVRRETDGRINSGARLAASSERDEFTGARHALDGNNTTHWSAASDEGEAWLRMDLGEPRDFARQELRFEYAWRAYAFVLESSLDGEGWSVVEDRAADPAGGSPVVVSRRGRARYLRLRFPANAAGPTAALFDWAVFAN